jgi:hypothetical protein
MQRLLLLHDLELVPVIELAPSRFSARSRPLPSGSGGEMPGEWGRYWSKSLADSGITGLRPLRPGSWHVPTSHLVDLPTLEKILGAIMRDRGGLEALSDPDTVFVLDGGLALRCDTEVLVKPTCCSDLGNLTDWREAAGYRGTEWTVLWIGHPWLSVRFEDGWLVLSEPHESEPPVGRWAVGPDVLGMAITAAEVELGDFARMLERALMSLGSGDRAEGLVRRLTGLAS